VIKQETWLSIASRSLIDGSSNTEAPLQ